MQTRLTTYDGETLTAEVLPTDAPRATVVLVHGFAAGRSDANVRALAGRLAQDRYEAIVYDARGHGASSGVCTLGDAERYDVRAAVSFARERADRPVIVVGASMGAIAAVRYAAEDGDLDGLVTISSPATWQIPRNARSAFAALLTQTGMGRSVASRLLNVRMADAWTAADSPAQLAPRVEVPWVIVHGRGDRFIDPRQALRLREAATGPRELRLVRGMGHAFDPIGTPDVIDGLEWILRMRVHA